MNVHVSSHQIQSECTQAKSTVTSRFRCAHLYANFPDADTTELMTKQEPGKPKSLLSGFSKLGKEENFGSFWGGDI